jgi:cellulase
MTPHPCKGNSCDKSGCLLSPYANGQPNLWGLGMTVDTKSPVTVVTQFMASGGKLTQITRKYIQNGRTSDGGKISTCGNEGTYGGLTGMGQALGRGSKCSCSPPLPLPLDPHAGSGNFARPELGPLSLTAVGC